MTGIVVKLPRSKHRVIPSERSNGTPDTTYAQGYTIPFSEVHAPLNIF